MQPEITLPLLVASGLIVGVSGASLVVLALVIARFRQGSPLVEYEPRSPVPWTGADLALILLVLVALMFAAAYIVGPTGLDELRTPDVPTGGLQSIQAKIEVNIPAAPSRSKQVYKALLQLDAAAKLLATAFAIVLVTLRAGAGWRDLGLSREKFGSDVRLGVIGFLAVFIPIYALQLALTQFVPSEHPIVKLLQLNSDPELLLWCLFAAVVVAPITEEFMFRLLFQGWLESLEQRWLTPNALETVGLSTTNATPDFSPALSGAEDAEARITDEANPYRSPAAVDEQHSLLTPGPETRRGNRLILGRFRPGTLPIVVSALPFALLHLGNGPDPIPLFFLALVLGYLYRQTHRIVPCIVLHMCLNGWSMAMLWLALQIDPSVMK